MAATGSLARASYLRWRRGFCRLGTKQLNFHSPFGPVISNCCPNTPLASSSFSACSNVVTPGGEEEPASDVGRGSRGGADVAVALRARLGAGSESGCGGCRVAPVLSAIRRISASGALLADPCRAQPSLPVVAIGEPIRRSWPLSSGRGAPAAKAAVLIVDVAGGSGKTGSGAGAGVCGAATTAGRRGGPPSNGSMPTVWLKSLQPASRRAVSVDGNSPAQRKPKVHTQRLFRRAASSGGEPGAGNAWRLSLLCSLPILTCFAYRLD